MKSLLVDVFRHIIERIDKLGETKCRRLRQLLVPPFRATSRLEGRSGYLCRLSVFARRTLEKHFGVHMEQSTQKEDRLWYLHCSCSASVEFWLVRAPNLSVPVLSNINGFWHLATY